MPVLFWSFVHKTLPPAVQPSNTGSSGVYTHDIPFIHKIITRCYDQSVTPGSGASWAAGVNRSNTRTGTSTNPDECGSWDRHDSCGVDPVIHVSVMTTIPPSTPKINNNKPSRMRLSFCIIIILVASVMASVFKMDAVGSLNLKVFPGNCSPMYPPRGSQV